MDFYLYLFLFNLWDWWLPSEKIIWILQSGHCLPSFTQNNRLLYKTLLCEALDTVEKSLFAVCDFWMLFSYLATSEVPRWSDMHTIKNMHSGLGQWYPYTFLHEESQHRFTAFDYIRYTKGVFQTLCLKSLTCKWAIGFQRVEEVPALPLLCPYW